MMAYMTQYCYLENFNKLCSSEKADKKKYNMWYKYGGILFHLLAIGFVIYGYWQFFKAIHFIEKAFIIFNFSQNLK